MLIPDERLRRLLLRALLYMVLHHPLLLIRAAWKARLAARAEREQVPPVVHHAPKENLAEEAGGLT